MDSIPQGVTPQSAAGQVSSPPAHPIFRAKTVQDHFYYDLTMMRVFADRAKMNSDTKLLKHAEQYSLQANHLATTLNRIAEAKNDRAFEILKAFVFTVGAIVVCALEVGLIVSLPVTGPLGAALLGLLHLAIGTACAHYLGTLPGQEKQPGGLFGFKVIFLPLVAIAVPFYALWYKEKHIKEAEGATKALITSFAKVQDELVDFLIENHEAMAIDIEKKIAELQKEKITDDKGVRSPSGFLLSINDYRAALNELNQLRLIKKAVC